MEKEINYTLKLQDWPVTNDGSVKKVMTRELNLSRKEISRLKFDGEILLNGSPVRVNDHMRVGDTLTLRFPEQETGSTPILNVEPDILYEDEDFVVVNKPAGIVSHPVHGHQHDSMGTILASWYQKKNEEFVIRPIGRLDKDVSGVAIYAKNRPGAARLSRDMEEGNLQKHYTAFVSGTLSTRSGIIDEPIDRVEGERRRVVGSPDGKPARTFYRVTHELPIGSNTISVLAVEIDSGRTHQIRTHLASIGYPILGDELYGGDMSLIRRPALHCAMADILTPFTRIPVMVKAPLPEDMRHLIEPPEEPELKLNLPPKKQLNDKEITDIVYAPEPERAIEMEQPEEPAVVEFEPEHDGRIKMILLILLAALILGAAGFFGYRWFANSRQQKTVKKTQQAEIYEALSIQFKDDKIVEYGGDFHPENYVVSARGTVSVDGTINTGQLGNQEVVYVLSETAEDGTEIRKEFPQIFTVKDTLSPEITLKEPEVEIQLEQDYDPKENVVSVVDPVDGETTYEVDESEFVTNTPGTYTVKVSAKDKSGNIAEKSFTVTVTAGKASSAAEKKEKEPEKKQEKKETAEKEKTASASPSPSASPAPSASPSPGPTAAAVTDKSAPVIVLGAQSVSITTGDSFSPGSLITSVTDDTDGNLVYADQLSGGTYTVRSDVSPDEPGTYTVTVSAMDRAGNQNEASVLVQVAEKKAENKPAAIVADSSDPLGQIYSFLVNQMDFNHAQACGILANMHRESRLNPTSENSLGYYGLCQWGNDRKDNLISWCEENGYDYTTIDGQLHFMQYEMPLYYPNTTSQLRAATNDEEGARRACWVFAIGYEVAGEEYAEMSKDKAVEYYYSLG